jgi:hypothetical protein
MIDKSILERIEKGFKEKVDNQVHIQSEGKDRYRVFTPFIFEDGDHFSIILKKEDGGWVLSDEGHTLMHLSWGQSRINFDDKSRAITANQLFEFGTQEINGELISRINNERYGHALHGFIQAIKKILRGRR